MKPLDARNEHYTLIDMDGHICLFTNMRLDRDTIPEGLHCYDVRDDSGDGTFAQIQNFVMVDHWGTIITKDPIPMDPQWHCYWPKQDAEYFSNDSFTLEEFQTTPIAELLARAQGDSLASRMQSAQERAAHSQDIGSTKTKDEPARE